MLSKKMAFSLTSLITIFALAFAVPSVMADDIGVTLSYDEAENVDGRHVDVTIAFNHDVSLAEVQKLATTVTVVMSDFTSVKYQAAMNTTPAFGFSTVPVADSVVLVTGWGGIMQKDMDASTVGNQFDGRTFTFRIPHANTDGTMAILPRMAEADDATTTNVDESAVGATRIYVSVPAGASALDPAHAEMSLAATLDIPLRTVAAMQDRDTPAVVSIQRLRPGSQTVVAAFQEAAVTGPFTVRIVLSETPHEPGKFASKINVANGTKSGFVVGTPFAWHGGRSGADATPPNAPIPGQTIRPHPIEGRYNHDGVRTPALGDPDADAAGVIPYPPLAHVPEGLDEVKVPLPTGPNGMYWECRIMISPHRRADHVIVKIDEFHDGDTPRNYYYPHQVDRKPNGREQLRLPVSIPAFALEPGLKVVLPHSEGAQITYANSTAGHYILTKNKDGSSIRYFHEKDEENKATEQTPAQLLYNVRASDSLPNLETFLANNGTIHLVSYGGHAAGSAYISEVMWGTDASQDPVNNSNWIEIRNGTTAAIGIAENIWALWFYEAHETPATAYPANTAYEGPTGQAGTIIDVIGTKDGTSTPPGRSWSIAGKGNSGRTNIDTARVEHQVLTPTRPLASMYRVMNADGTLSDGTQAASWMQTPSPSVNLAIGRENAIIATPGAAPFDTPDALAADAKAKADAAAAAKAAADAAAAKKAATGTYPMQGDGRVYISEVMFAGGGTLPQWIEIANGDRTKEFNLSGWTITVDNATADADVSVSSAKFTIPDGTMIKPSGQWEDGPSTLLVVTERGRNSFDGAIASGQVINLAVDNETELIIAGILRGKYALLSDMAFLITLAPPVPAATKAPAGETSAAKAQRQAAEKKSAATRKAAMDMAGNLGKDGTAAWALPMNEGGARSSIIRKHVQVARGPAAPEDGMMEDNWTLASNTSFAQVTHIRAQSYYGAANDVGTPGFRAGGALPVELSHFSPARDKVTDAVVITWSTESELNNAGFFIKRSQQRDGEFKVINATMVPGAGTTSEKQFYTYTDTTAQPNVVYYYQIEDVSLDSNRQTLTRGIRLKGHVGAAGKATTLWGELKTSHE